MRRRLQRWLRPLAVADRRAERLYRALFHLDGTEYAQLLRERGEFHAIGEHCYIDPYATIAQNDRGYIRIGNNVRLSNCVLLGHDGSVNMINRAYGLKLDHVGKIDIRDNVYIGHGAIVLPNVTIGPNAIVCAGSVVRADVKPGEIVAGVPARAVGRLDVSVQILAARNRKFPWQTLIELREGDYDAALEPELRRMRIEHFYGTAEPAEAGASAAGAASAATARPATPTQA